MYISVKVLFDRAAKLIKEYAAKNAESFSKQTLDYGRCFVDVCVKNKIKARSVCILHFFEAKLLYERINRFCCEDCGRMIPIAKEICEYCSHQNLNGKNFFFC